MPAEACPLPTPPADDEATVVRRLLSGKRIAIVGLSDDPGRASYHVASYLRDQGKEIIPVNPNHPTIMGMKSHASLQMIGGPIDVVDVFRRPEYCADVVRDAIAAGAKGVWLQSGIVSEEAERLAREAGIDFVQDRCMMVEHMQGGA